MPAESMGGRVISRRRFLQGGAAAAAAAAFSAYLPVALRDAIAGSLEDDPAFDVSQV
jgi:hypothetical protein